MCCSSCERPVSPGSLCNYCGVKAPGSTRDYAPHSSAPAPKMSGPVLVLFSSLLGASSPSAASSSVYILPTAPTK